MERKNGSVNESVQDLGYLHACQTVIIGGKGGYGQDL